MTTLILAPVLAANSGAWRCSGSAICGPVKVNTFTVTPAYLPVPDEAPVVLVGAAAAVVSVGAAAATVSVGAAAAVVS